MKNKKNINFLALAKEMQSQTFKGSKAVTFFEGKDIFGNIIKIRPNEDLVFFNHTTGRLYMGSLTWITCNYLSDYGNSKKGVVIINTQRTHNYNIINKDTDLLLKNFLGNCITDPGWSLEKLAIAYLNNRFFSKPKIFVNNKGKYFKIKKKKPFYYETKYNDSKKSNNQLFENSGYVSFKNSNIGFICKMDALKNKQYFLKGFISKYVFKENLTVNQIVINDYDFSRKESKYTNQYIFNVNQKIIFTETNHPDCCGQKIIYGHKTGTCYSDIEAERFWKVSFNIDEKNIKDLREVLSLIGRKAPIMVHLTDNQLCVNSYLYIKLFGKENVKKIHTYNNPSGGNRITILQINVYDYNLQETSFPTGNCVNNDYIRFVLYWLENLKDKEGVLVYSKKDLLEKTKNIIKKTKKDFLKKVGIGIRAQIECG